MSEAELRSVILDVLGGIAPEADLSALAPAVDLRQQLDIDSFDFLTFIVRLHERLGVEVPEADYGQLRTLSDCLAYLSRRSARPGGPA